MAVDSTTTGDTDDDADAKETPARRSRWLRRGFLLMVIVGGGLYAAPLGVARYLETRDLSVTGADGEVFSVRAAEASLGWFSPVRLRDVRIEDADGQTLLQVKTIVSERSLSSLATDHRRPGRFIIDHPTVDVIVRPDGSNLEDFLFALQGKESNSAQFADIGVTITQGTVSFRDTEGVSLATISNIDADVRHQVAADQSMQFDLTALVEQDGEQHPIATALEWRGPREGLPFLSGAGSLAIKFAPLPLVPLQHQVARMLPRTTIQSGSLEGQLLIEADFRDAQSLTATGQLVSRDVLVSQSSPEGIVTRFQWPEEQLAFNIDGQHNPASGVIDISEFTLQSTPVAISATGTIADASGECVVDVAGNLRYDVSQLVQSLTADVREHLRIDGLHTRSFGIRGPLAKVIDGRPRWDLSRLSVEADLGWDTADVFGIRSEQATIAARFQNGILHIDPSNVPVSGGRFSAAPDIALLSEQPTASIGRGPVLENVQFSEEMCRLWLKYLSPVMADATRVNGRFSIHVDEGQFPLQNMSAGNVRGKLQVHAAEVRPGPFAEKVVGLISTIRSLISRKPGAIPTDRMLITMDEQQIPFVMADGRVHHERLTFAIAGAVVRTSGSVGFDESLDLVIEVPLPESWFKNRLVAGAAEGEVIRIPVRGTLDRPQFDLKILRELTRRFATNAAAGLLQKLLD